MFTKKTYRAFLFDMDGTILTSIAAAERVWGRWASSYGIDVERFLPTIHGARAVDTIRRLNLPNVDPELEAARITQWELEDLAGIHPIGGAVEFLGGLPIERWAIVTSAPRELALRRIAAAGLPEPEVLISAEDVRQGKPAPDGYLLGMQRLNINADECLVFEDAHVGINAAKAAGTDVVVITETHSQAFITEHPTLDNYHALESRCQNGWLSLLRK